MHVRLRADLEKFISEKVQTGQYADPSEVVNEALQALKEQEEFTPEHLAYLRREVQRGVEQLDRGEHADFDAEKIIAEARKNREGSLIAE